MSSQPADDSTPDPSRDPASQVSGKRDRVEVKEEEQDDHDDQSQSSPPDPL